MIGAWVRVVVAGWLGPGAASAATCGSYTGPEIVAEVSGSTITEASGLAASRTRPGVFFTHGDSGAGPVVAAFDASGALLDEHTVVDAINEDWEDIVAAPCPDAGDCLYIGDIGDNDATRTTIAVYVVREPEAGDAKIRTIRQVYATYPDGPRDAEALLMMPCTGRLHVVTKDPAGESVVYRFPADPEDTVALERVAGVQLDGPTAESREVTGGAWDEDGERLALRTADRVFEWVTDPAKPNDHWLTPPLELVGAGESQGEGLTYGTDGDLYGTGEGTPIPLTRYTCDDLGGGDGTCTFPQTGKSCGCDAGGGGSGLAVAAGLLAGLVRSRGSRLGAGIAHRRVRAKRPSD